MRVLLVTPEFPPDHGGGIATYYRELSMGLLELGCEVQVLRGSQFAHGDGSTYCSAGVTVSTLRSSRFEHWLGRFRGFGMFPELKRHLAATFALHEEASDLGSFDAIEVVDWGLMFLPWVLQGGHRLLVQFHGSSGQILRHEPVAGRGTEALLTLLLEQAGIALAQASSSYSRANAAWWEGMATLKPDYIPPPISPVLGMEISEEGRGGWLTAARVQQWKGPQTACKAWRLIGKQAPELEWFGRDTLHGASGLPTAQWLMSEYPEVWNRSIVHRGPVSPADLQRALWCSRFALVPSSWDVFNLFAAEAMSCGCVVVASDGAGASELIDHGRNGFVFPADDPEALAELVQELLTLQTPELERIGAAGRRTVEEVLAPSSVAARKLQLYASLSPKVPADDFGLGDLLLNQESRAGSSFLDAIPLRDLGGNVVKRLKSKLTGKA